MRNPATDGAVPANAATTSRAAPSSEPRGPWRSPLGFSILFAATFAVLMVAWEASRGTTTEEVLLQGAFLLPSAAMIEAISPTEPVAVVGRSIVGPHSKLRVTRGCEGVETVLLAIAAVLAFPSLFRRKLEGLLIGVLVAYTLSVLRLVGLHFALRYSQAAWETLHGLVAPLLPIVGVGLFFLWWVRRVVRVTPHAT